MTKGQKKESSSKLPAPQDPKEMMKQQAPKEDSPMQSRSLDSVSHPAIQTHAANKGFLRQYADSWKEVKSFRFFMVVLFDMLFYLLLFPLAYGYSRLIGSLATPFKNIDPNALASQTAEQLAIYQQSLSGTIVFIFLLSLAFLLLFILLWSASRAFIWTRLLDKKLTGRYMGKFYLLNLLWSVLWLIVFAVFSLLFYKGAMASKTLGLILGIVFLLVCIKLDYFMYILYYKFTEGDNGQNRVFGSLSDAFRLGVTRFPKLWLPLLMVVLTLVAASLISLPLKLLPAAVMDVLSYLMFFIVFGWIKVYSAEAVRRGL